MPAEVAGVGVEGGGGEAEDIIAGEEGETDRGRFGRTAGRRDVFTRGRGVGIGGIEIGVVDSGAVRLGAVNFEADEIGRGQRGGGAHKRQGCQRGNNELPWVTCAQANGRD